MPATLYPFEFVLTEVGKGETRSFKNRDGGGRQQNFARPGEVHDSFRDVDRQALNALEVTLHFACVNSDSNLDAVLPGHPADRGRADGGSRGAIEESKKAVAGGLALFTVVFFQFQPYAVVMPRQ